MTKREKTTLQLDGILLGLLAEKPMHGYDLSKNLRQPGGTSLVWRINQSNLYAILEKMEKEGWLISNRVNEENSRPRKEYRVSSTGLEMFNLWMRSPVLHSRDMRHIFLAKLHFALKDGRETASQLIDSQYSQTMQWKNDFQSKLDALKPEQTYERLVFQSREFQVSAWLRLLDQCKSEILSLY